MKYKNFVANLDKKILKWYYAIPIGILTTIISSYSMSFGGVVEIIGTAIGVFNLLILVGIVSGIAEIVKYFRNK